MLIKSVDDQTIRYRLLKELQKSPALDHSQKQWLKKQLNMMGKGSQGEKNAAFHIDSAFKSSNNVAVLHDLRLVDEGDVAQIDHLIFDRTLKFYLLETKFFSGNLDINESLEFTVEYPGEKRVGIPSPIEQSKRHEPILRRVLAKLGILGRAGIAPTFEHLVLMHPSSIINRPPATVVDTSMVMKADQFPSWHARAINQASATETLKALLNVRSSETLKEWALSLKGEHKPLDPLYLPPSMKPKLNRVETTRTAELTPEQAATCAECGESVSEKVLKFCRDHSARFGGKVLCYAHQPR